MTAKKTNAYSRRQIISGLGSTLAAAALSSLPAFAQESTKPSPQPKSEPLRDPTTRYPRPPFESQSQPWPGLAGKMRPRPDHGETSYVGSGRLKGRKALITGGDS